MSDSPVALSGTPQPASASYIPSVIAGFGGWLLEAFDFFLIAFSLTALAREFHKTDVQVALLITLTMAFRPVGGLLFGAFAERYGRKRLLMINIASFVVVELLTAEAGSFMMLMAVRSLFGIVMGGNWGLGTSLAMESVPTAKRGIFSGLLQEGYAAGNILASLCYLFFFERLGWRPLFLFATVPAAMLVAFIGVRVQESSVWLSKRRAEAHSASKPSGSAAVFGHWKLFLYLLVFMTTMLFASHGTQDMYPTFLQRQWHFAPTMKATITAIAGLGAIVGGILFGHYSDRVGRRRTIITAFVLCLVVTPLWAFAPSKLLLVGGAFLMQFAVQGAWGVVPVYLAELAPNNVRALLPGLAYQAASVLAGSVVLIETAYARRTSYASAMALTAASIFLCGIIVTLFGSERHKVDFAETKTT